MTICFSLTNLSLGGAQVFVVRLASWLARNTNHIIYIYDHWPEHRHRGILRGMDRRVQIISYNEHPFRRWLVWKMNAALAIMRKGAAWRYRLNRRRFEKFLGEAMVDVVNSHMSYSDFVVSEVTLPPGCRFIPTFHGEYELLLAEPHPAGYFSRRICESLAKADGFIYTADKNMRSVSRCKTSPGNKLKIYPGLPDREKSIAINRKRAGIQESGLVAGMIGRGIPEKGWQTAIDAVIRYNAGHSDSITLVLIGDGSWISELVQKMSNPRIKLFQFGDNFEAYFSYYALFDLFLFPSRFEGESVPNAVIESLYWNVPVLASAVAEIPQMLLSGSNAPAGVCVPVGETFESDFYNAFASLASDPVRLRTMSGNCGNAFSQFRMETIAPAYIRFFEEISATGK